jgi:hypothetical protein
MTATSGRRPSTIGSYRDVRVSVGETVRVPWLRLVPAVALVAIATWETCATVRAGDDVPGDAAWKRAAAAVREKHATGDLIVFAPAWIDPVGRMHLGDLIPIDHAARLDAARFATIWEVSIRDERAPETAGLRPTWSASFDGVTVRRFEQAPAQIATDFVAAFGAGPNAVTTDPPGRRPSVVLAEVGFAPHRCVQIEPPPGGTVSMTIPGAELGREIVGGVGLADVFTRRDVRDPGELAIRVGGVEVAKKRFGVDDGWVRFRASTTPGRADVTFVATAVGPKARQRLICFAAEARK